MTIDSGKHYLPDVSIACHEQNSGKKTSVAAPNLVVEVLSESTQAYDLGNKLIAYRDCISISTIIIVWQDRRRVEMHERQAGTLWTMQPLVDHDTYTLHYLPVTLALDDIYFDTDGI